MAFLPASIRNSINPTEPCGICGRTRREHWGRRSALAPQKLGHQWRPVDLEAGERQAEELAVEQAYAELERMNPEDRAALPTVDW